MRKTKKMSRWLALALAAVMAFPGSAWAATAGSWNQYQGDSTHSGVITEAPLTASAGTLADSSSNVTKITLDYSGSGWSGVDTSPVMETVDGTTYAYVVYNGRSNGGQLAQVNCATGAVKYLQISTSNSFQLSTPYLDTDSGRIYTAATTYYNLLSNSEFTTTDSWTCSSASITTGSTEEEAYVTIPAGGSVSQSFTVESGSSNSQLTSGLKLAEEGTSATVTYSLGSTTLATQEVTSAEDWTYVEEVGSSDISTAGDYTITVTVTGASVICDYVKYSTYTSGVVYTTRDMDQLYQVGAATYGGQINTPLTVSGNYLYFGTYSGSYYYYQIDLTNLDDPSACVKKYKGNSHFYWAGASVVDDTVYFGGDGGYLYQRSVSDFENTGTVTALSSAGVTPGNVRSSILVYGTDLYFTSQGGYLWKYSISDGSLIYANIGGTSTSTPTISENGYIYVGCYGSSVKGVKALAVSDFSANITSASDSTWKTIYTDDTSTIYGKVQASVIVYTSGNYDYVYFTTNTSDGAGYCYQVSKTRGTSSSRWSTSDSTYMLQGMASCGGYLTFGNDNNEFFIVNN
ncbi:MAG: hypothetical protein LUF00_11455 [Lachnospiraceae bacterium]|nr:hypothetical protein [Lachnospiraceae bacterium]